MKISTNWLADYLVCELPPSELAEILTATGLEVEKVEKIESVPGGLRGVVVGEVVQCEQHPNADRLRLTRVNIGSGEPLQIVCGAPNVAIGQKVLVATIGTTLYPSEGEPLTIRKGKIRGEESHGMICAEDELGLGKSHDGILVLDTQAVPGTSAAEFLKLKTDHVLEIGLTPNRTDAFSHIGVARDLAAALGNMEGLTRVPFSMQKPSTAEAIDFSKLPAFSVEVNNEDACPRYAGVIIDHLTVAPSPEWLQQRLQSIGLRPINNVVDITNFVQHEMGQPLHAFDADKIGGKRIVVRLAHEGELFTTLDGVQRTLSSQDLVICDDQKPMCLAGIFGGAESGVSATTKSIFLESAWFNPLFVRKSGRRHGLHTDASFRFERGVDPQGVVTALLRTVQLLSEIAGGKATSSVTDLYPIPAVPAEVEYDWQRTTRLIGKEIPKDKVRSILIDLDFHITQENNSGLLLSVPPYRTDVHREADVVEEVLRIYGYDHIDFSESMRTSLSHASHPDAEKTESRVARALSAREFSEIMGMSLTKKKYTGLTDAAETREEEFIELLNPLSSDLAGMRQTLLYTGLEAIALNQNYRNTDLKIYEFGNVYHRRNGGFEESRRLALFLTGRRNPESWNTTADSVDFSDLKASIEYILGGLGISVKSQPATHPFFQESIVYTVGKTEIGIAGSVRSEILETMDIRQPAWFADMKWTEILKFLPEDRVGYQQLEKFPAVRRDLSLLVDLAVDYADLERVAHEAERKLLRRVGLFDVYEGKNLEPGKKSYALNFTFQDSTRTLTDDQVDTAIARISAALGDKLGAVVRS